MALYVNGPGGGDAPKEVYGPKKPDLKAGKNDADNKAAEAKKAVDPATSEENDLVSFEEETPSKPLIKDPKINIADDPLTVAKKITVASVETVVEHPIESIKNTYEIADTVMKQPGFWDNLKQTASNVWEILTTGKIHISKLLK